MNLDRHVVWRHGWERCNYNDSFRGLVGVDGNRLRTHRVLSGGRRLCHVIMSGLIGCHLATVAGGASATAAVAIRIVLPPLSLRGVLQHVAAVTADPVPKVTRWLIKRQQEQALIYSHELLTALMLQLARAAEGASCLTSLR